MATTMFQNMKSIVANTRSNDIKMIDINELHESSDNFFEVNGIEEFADTILGQGGVKDNLIVRPLETGGYEIISGHRRKAAVQYLIDTGKSISKYLPCMVEKYEDQDAKMLDLILMNVSQRQISDAEMLKSYEVLNRIFHEKKEKGEKFGRLREKISEILNVSPAQIGKLQNIEKHAIPEVKKAVEEGELSLSIANELAKMDSEEQKKITEKKNFSDIKHKDVKQTITRKNNKTDKSVEKKVDTCINLPENRNNEEKLIFFVRKNKSDLTKLLSVLADVVDTESESKIISKFNDIISNM